MLRLSLFVSLFMGLSPLTFGFFHWYGRVHTVNEDELTVDEPSDKQTTLPEHWFKQKLDHFNPADNRDWQQRYYINDRLYKPGGPVFLYIGPESSLPEIFARTGSWVEYAKFYKALCFAVEHRYYGKSQPTTDLSTANLQYLSVEQVLEDLAAFITTTSKEHNLTDAKWVTFGGSYAGLLSAWMRYKFPHLVSGAVAHSSPIDVPIDAPEYFVGIGEELRTVPGCYDAVRSAFDDVRDKLKTDAGAKDLRDIFILCDFDRNKKLDVENFMINLLSPLISATQYSDNHNEYLTGGLKQESLSDICKVMTDKTRGPPFDRYVEFARISLHNFTARNGSCADVSFDSVIAEGKKLSYADNLIAISGRQWKYQVCTQMGLFVTTESDNQPFGNIFSEDYFLMSCEGYFGSNFNKSLLLQGHEDIMMNYGGRGILATNIVYTQGSFDPWHKYGFTRDPIPGAHAILINGVGHAADLYSSSPLDNADLKQARTLIQRYIGQWISSGETGFIG